MILRFYRTLTNVGAPIISAYLNKRRRAGKEDPIRFGERLGNPGKPRPSGPLVWLHGASVGEGVSLLPLVERLLAENVNVLITTGSVTSAKLMEKRLPEGAIHQYVPVDRLPYVQTFLAHWQPNLAVWCESEFWPNLICETVDGGGRAPLILVNGRVSSKSFRNWQKAHGFISGLLGRFDLCMGQTTEDAARLGRLGAKKTACHGNLKFAAPPLPADETQLAELKGAIGTRPVWLAASTHAGEEVLIGRVHTELKKRYPALLTIIAPRHPDRGPTIAADLRCSGHEVSERSKAHPLLGETDIYLADTMGELGLFYRLTQAVFMGKSLLARGGQNPLEPACLGCAIVHGPYMDNFVEMADEFYAARASLQVEDEAGLVETIGHLLSDPSKREALGLRAKTLAEQKAGVLDAVMGELQPYLTRIKAPETIQGESHARP